jgi:hypothetical protein
MWVYWAQSVIIGVSNFLRILDLKEFSTKGYRIMDQPVPPTRGTQIKTAVFFLIHYGFFHLIYFIFLATKSSFTGAISKIGVIACVVAFACNHRYSYVTNRERDRTRKPNIGAVMFFPYARIIPMHLTIMFGVVAPQGSPFSLVLFLGLKTLADVIMHMYEHSNERLLETEGKRQHEP